jgi:hypothetical protein|tara:strand:+ start:1055 stop:2173 length:1119 start_codon:yes stop_codon:yes gene_type:complete
MAINNFNQMFTGQAISPNINYNTVESGTQNLGQPIAMPTIAPAIPNLGSMNTPASTPQSNPDYLPNTPLLTAQTNESYITDLSTAGPDNTPFDPTAPSTDFADILDTYDTRALMNEYGQYFDPYDLSQEAFAQRNLAMQEDAINARLQQQQRGFETQQTQGRMNLANIYEQQQENMGGGFAGSGRRDIQAQRAIDAERGTFENQLFNLRDVEQTAQRDLDRASLGFEQDVFGMRQRFASDTRDTLLKLLETGADLKRFEIGTAEQKVRTNPQNNMLDYTDPNFDADVAFEQTMGRMDDAFGTGEIGYPSGVTSTPTVVPEIPFNVGGGIQGDFDALNPIQPGLSQSAQDYMRNREGYRDTTAGQNFYDIYGD